MNGEKPSTKETTVELPEDCRSGSPPGSSRIGFAKANGQEFERVTQADILKAVREWRTAESVGEALWPHLIGRGPASGGPSSCAVAATFQLSKLEHAGLVVSRRDHGPRQFRAAKRRPTCVHAATGHGEKP